MATNLSSLIGSSYRFVSICRIARRRRRRFKSSSCKTIRSRFLRIKQTCQLEKRKESSGNKPFQPDREQLSICRIVRRRFKGSSCKTIRSRFLRMKQTCQLEKSKESSGNKPFQPDREQLSICRIARRRLIGRSSKSDIYCKKESKNVRFNRKSVFVDLESGIMIPSQRMKLNWEF